MNSSIHNRDNYAEAHDAKWPTPKRGFPWGIAVVAIGFGVLLGILGVMG